MRYPHGESEEIGEPLGHGRRFHAPMTTHGSAANVLYAVVAGGYHAVQRLRETAYERGLLTARSAPVPVLSVGNLLMGGSGKTPFAIYLAERLQTFGLRPAVVSRGYGGSNREPFLVIGDGTAAGPLAGPSVSGDEPYLIARRLPEVPVIVGRKRIHPARAACELFGCRSVVLDDGFQHLPLKRNADIVLLSGSEDGMFPLGSLREPFSALQRAHVILLTGDDPVMPSAAAEYASRLPVFHGRVIAEALETATSPGATADPAAFAGREVVLFSAIAGPERFRRTAEGLGWLVRRHLVFRDHHVLTARELQDVADAAGGAPIVCTEKDWVKLPESFREAANVAALRIRATVVEEKAFWETLAGFIPGLSTAKLERECS
jgi:tetraacyldisaccharide 4'-kinase